MSSGKKDMAPSGRADRKIEEPSRKKPSTIRGKKTPKTEGYLREFYKMNVITCFIKERQEFSRLRKILVLACDMNGSDSTIS